MASVRKRSWQAKSGEIKTGWQVDYVDQQGTRRRKMFTLKKAADAFALTAQSEVREGTHIVDATSLTVAQAGADWLRTAKAVDDPPLEVTTLEQYQQHLALHIVPFLGRTKLSKLSVPVVRNFADQLRAAGRSATMVRYVIRSLGSLLADAQERGNIVRNPVHEMRNRRRRHRKNRERRGAKLKIGVDVPTPEEIRRILATTTGRDRVFLMTAVFTGLRASELRGLSWPYVNLRKSELHVTQRADRHRDIGEPKTVAAQRTIPLPPPVTAALREWRLACPKGPLDLVFPNGVGRVEFHVNIIHRIFWPAQIAAGVVIKTPDRDGNVSVAPKYAGLHALRHFYASWCINRKVDGGLELPPKVVQSRLGHSSIVVTMDTYGQLFPRADDAPELTEAAEFLLKR
jgi:integrase